MGLRAGGAVSALTLGTREVFLVGYGPGDRRRARLDPGALRLRAILLEDDAGDRVALLSGDFWSASAAVLQHLADLVEAVPALHLDRARLFFAGTHTHSSLGGLHESPFYATYAGDYWCSRGFDDDLAQQVASQLLALLYRAEAALEDAVAERGAAVFDQHSINRSYGAFVRNALPGFDPSPLAGEASQRTAINPALKLVRFRSAADPARTLGVWGAVNCHATALGKNHVKCNADFIGTASAMLEGADASAAVPWVLCAGAMGDVDPQPAGLGRQAFVDERKASEAQSVAQMLNLAGALAAAVRAATWEPPALIAKLTALKTYAFAPAAKVGAEQLPALPMVGDPVLAGSELAKGQCAEEGSRDLSPGTAPHWPKSQLNLITQTANADVRRHTPFLPLSIFKLGGAMWLVGLPGEPTTTMGRSIEARLRALAAGAEVMVCGVTGDYSGYFVTRAEYEAQHYEGASCLWGRHSQEFLLAQLEALAAVPAMGPPVPMATLRPPGRPVRPRARNAAEYEAHTKQAMRSAPRAARRPKAQKTARLGKLTIATVRRLSAERDVLLEIRVGPHALRLRPADHRRVKDGRWRLLFFVDQRLLKYRPRLVPAAPLRKTARAPPG